MRNLKKFLALVLAMMMVMGFMVTANAATTADFKDKDEVDEDYKEAMDVLVSLGIVTGTGGDKISPTMSFDRKSLATMVYKIMTGDVDAKRADLAYMAKEPMFTDVPAGQWYTGFINYVCEAGWMSGTSTTAKTFEPDRTLTLEEVVVSMAKILGMGVDTGNWEKDKLAMIIAASNNGLIAGLKEGDSIGGTAKRQIASQIMFNSMTYIPTENGKAGKPVVKWALTGVAEHFNTTTEAESYATQNGMGKAGTEGGPAIEKHTSYPDSLADNVFGLHKAEGGFDDFHRPTVAWNDDKEIPVVETAIDPYLFRASGKFTGTDAKALLRNVKNDREKLVIYYNGSKPAAADPNIEFYDLDNSDAALWINDTTGINGYEVWVYTNNAGGYDVIVREAYVAQVTAATKPGNDITLDIYEVGWAYGEGNATTDAKTFNNPTVSMTVKKSTDEDLYNKLAKYDDEAYIAVYAAQDFDQIGNKVPDKNNPEVEIDYSDKTASDFILEVADLTPVDVEITHIHDNGQRILSKLEVNDGKATYQLNNESLWTNGKAVCANVIKGANERATQLGDATLYLLDGKVLLVEQTDAELAGLHYGYLIDFKAISGNTAADDWIEGWKPDGKVSLKLLLKLDNGEEVEVDWLDQNGKLVYFEADTSEPDSPKTAKQVAEEFAETYLLDYIFEYNKNKKQQIAIVDGTTVTEAGEVDAAGELLTGITENCSGKGYGTDGEPLAETKVTYGGLVHPGYYGEGVTGHYVEGPETFEIVPGRAKGDLGDDAPVTFDDKTVFFVAETLGNLAANKIAKLKIYHGILDENLPKYIIDGEVENSKSNLASVGFVQYVTDNTTGRVICVLISVPTEKDDDDGEEETGSVFIAGYPEATLHKMWPAGVEHTDANAIEYYLLEAVVNGEWKQLKVAPSVFGEERPYILWVSGIKEDKNGIYTVDGDNLIDEDNTIVAIEWAGFNAVSNFITVKDVDPESSLDWENAEAVAEAIAAAEGTGYIATKTTKLWQFDEVKGTISTLASAKVSNKMVGFMELNSDGVLVALYLTIPTT